MCINKITMRLTEITHYLNFVSRGGNLDPDSPKQDSFGPFINDFKFLLIMELVGMDHEFVS